MKNKKDRNLRILPVYCKIVMLQGILVRFLSVNLVMDTCRTLDSDGIEKSHLCK